jgi:hypothetical protein
VGPAAARLALALHHGVVAILVLERVICVGLSHDRGLHAALGGLRGRAGPGAGMRVLERWVGAARSSNRLLPKPALRMAWLCALRARPWQPPWLPSQRPWLPSWPRHPAARRRRSPSPSPAGRRPHPRSHAKPLTSALRGKAAVRERRASTAAVIHARRCAGAPRTSTDSAARSASDILDNCARWSARLRAARLRRGATRRAGAANSLCDGARLQCGEARYCLWG